MLALVTVLSLSMLAAPAGAGDADALRKTATQHFRARRYAQACPLFERVARLVPKDPSAWADLGVCLVKLGRGSESIQASSKAASFGPGPIAKNAFYNLMLAGVSKNLPDPGDEPICQALSSDSECATKVFVCARHALQEDDGQGGGVTGTAVGFGVSKEEAMKSAQTRDHWFHVSDHVGAYFYASSCTLVFLDGCTRRAGMVCTTEPGRAAGVEVEDRPRTEAAEVAF